MTTATLEAAAAAVVDVVVVGAGLSGLICARDLRRQGLVVRVLEARDRCGGRMVGRRSATGLPLDLGGQWVGATHRRLIDLLEEFGLQRFPTSYNGDGVFHWNGTPHRAGVEPDFGSSFLFFQPQQLGLPQAELEEALALQQRFQCLVAQVPPAAPWTAPNAEALDRISLQGWLEGQGAGPLARYPLHWLARVGGSGGFEPHESSILHLAWTQAVAPQHETPEASLVHGGAAQVAERLAAELADVIRLRAPVGAIEQNAGGVRVSFGEGDALGAAAVVVAIPPPLRLGLRFSPDLPPDGRGLLQRSPMGSMVKVLALYPKPFWRERGLNGLGIGNLPTLELTVDSSPPEGPGLLASFISGDRAARWQRLPEAQRRRAVLADLAAWWGPAAADPSELVIHNWNEESWTGGAFTSFLSPGAWTRHGPVWQQPHGRVVWAGTEAACRWPGYFEGAIEAGLAASDQVQRQLGRGGL
ncbi:FAD-dependent oxidoreductase [Cyanobium sp. Morenito 9A2]|uniref:flavin monoamine oxidase family protein n=1 Tax=Cyanobium sp. Morenito 9A2 TaxID=2823718 RepID=UPI0020CD2677|nr:FAD-dependent oxidoreductase [Cyanobium sp. Morenito 9A2]MCP9850812.1 FAD-dependent oxidoreductase [Cyanobium sp. Morenito 9A2]